MKHRRVVGVLALIWLSGALIVAQAPPKGTAAKKPTPKEIAARDAAFKAETDKLLAGIDGNFDLYDKMQKQIWGFAEVGYQETKSSALLQSQLTAAGFTVKSGVADEPTGFVASFGSGKPVIGLLAEFDALPGLSQEAVPERKPVVANAPGHGCGHHLYGVGSVAAAIAVKDWLVAGNRPGTIRVYGTPAEEGGAGKVYQVRAGLFGDVDTVIHWHPGTANAVSLGSSLANVSAKFRFHGTSASSAGGGDKGRSALDAVQIFAMMVEMMREHVPFDTRMHYIITKGGGAPNVVPDFAEIWLYLRQPSIRVLDPIWDRLVEAAKGAGMGTGTKMDFEIIHGTYNVLPNLALSQLQQKSLERVGGVKYNAEEQAFAQKLMAAFPVSPGQKPPVLGDQEKVLPLDTDEAPGDFSTDAGDVSWMAPTVGLGTATWPPGTPGHAWQCVAAGGTTIGTKGMMVAAKTMALTAAELFANQDQIEKARAEWLKRRGDFVYKARVGDRKPPLDYRNY